MTDQILGRPLDVLEARARAAGETATSVTETAAPHRNQPPRQEGTLRVIRRGKNEWVAARFLDGAPRGKENA